MDEDIWDLLNKFNKKDPEQDKKARAELERTNSESELFFQVMEKKTISAVPKRMELSYKVGILA